MREADKRMLSRSTISGVKRGSGRAGAATLALVLLASLVSSTESAAAEDRSPAVTPELVSSLSERGSEASEGSIPSEDREQVLGADWQRSTDTAWMTVGDELGFHVYVASESDGYTWNPLVTLSAGSFDTDRWIGNACLTSSGSSLAVVYAPRAFTNDEQLFSVGGFAAIVDLASGEVDHLGSGYSLSYFNPGCGSDERVSLVADGISSTRIEMFSADELETRTEVEVDAQLTSVTPTASGALAAVAGAVVEVDDGGTMSRVAAATGTPYGLTVTGANSLVFLTHEGDRATAHWVDLGGTDAQRVLGEAPIDELGIRGDGAGNAHLLGPSLDDFAELPDHVLVSRGTAVDAVLSTEGHLGINSVAPAFYGPDDRVQVGADAVSVDGVALRTGIDVSIEVPEVGDFGRMSVDPALNAGQTRSNTEHSPDARNALSEDPHNPTSVGSVCAVPRNDPGIQAFQPNSAEVEWAVDLAITGDLGSAQSMFPLTPMSGGGRVPAQIMLGILAQESNFWQASKFVVPGVTGNPLVGNYFGADRFSSDADAWWQIDYASADCGYGIAQVTTGMRSGDMPYAQQLAIATDYQSNIARGLQILIEKWNETRDAGMKVNNGASGFVENWYYALWAYNTGFYPMTLPGQPWGVGWHNNPINPKYPVNRGSFLDGDPSDAANPQQWTYPEKVLGFAAHSVQFLQGVEQGQLGDSFSYGPAFTPSWWASGDGASGTHFRTQVQAPRYTFCDASNECDPNASHLPPGPVTDDPSACLRDDLKCWYHQPVTWKNDCDSQCGYAYREYDREDAKPASSNSYPPNCSTTGLPSGALVIDNLPSGAPPVRAGCAPVPSSGSFTFDFSQGPNGDYPSKIDMHQLGAGFNGQFYFSHVRIADTEEAFGGALNVSGTWTLGSNLNGWARVLVHTPSHGAWTQQARYTVTTGTGSVERIINQRNYADQWVSLGSFEFNNRPSITLNNHSADYSDTPHLEGLSGIDDIAWDAVAFVPLSGKPSEFIVALGDSFSSGEGTSTHNGAEFFRGTDHHGMEPIHQNACHRSPNAWPFKIDPAGIAGSQSVRQLWEANDPRLDFQMLACSGALTKNVMPSTYSGAETMYGEATQIDRNFLDQNTTLVTMSIGGNDVGFSPVIQKCITAYDPLNPASCEGYTPDDGTYPTLGEMVTANLGALPTKVTAVLNEVHSRAPNARVVLLGYPMLFETGGNCVALADIHRPWLNSVSNLLNSALTKAAYDAGDYVIYEDPQYRFAGHNLCSDQPAINGFVLGTTPGDANQFLDIPGQGTVGLSAQSIHPNKLGADLYGSVANNATRSTRLDVSGTLTAGEPTTYYATLRWIEGPTAMNISEFSACGGEMRIGLRTGAAGTQSTNTLSWSAPHSLQYFHTESASPSPDLPANYYAFNARMPTSCTDGDTQTWAGELYR